MNICDFYFKKKKQQINQRSSVSDHMQLVAAVAPLSVRLQLKGDQRGRAPLHWLLFLFLCFHSVSFLVFLNTVPLSGSLNKIQCCESKQMHKCHVVQHCWSCCRTVIRNPPGGLGLGLTGAYLRSVPLLRHIILLLLMFLFLHFELDEHFRLWHVQIRCSNVSDGPKQPGVFLFMYFPISSTKSRIFF